MLAAYLALGLFLSGGFGFLLGAKPGLIRTLFLSHKNNSSLNIDENQRLMDYLYPLAVAFFAGFVFSTLVPDALTHSRGTLLAFGLGLLTMAALSKLVFKRDPCCETGHDYRGFGAMSLLAMSVCSLNDGLLIGLLNPVWYSGLNLGMLIHKISSSFAIAQVLRRSKYKEGGLLAFGIGYTLISPLALFLVNSGWIKSLPNTEWILAFSAGLLTYVTLTSLVPHARTIIKRQPRAIIGFVIAFLISISLGLWHTALHGHMDLLEEGNKNTPSQFPTPTPGSP